MRVIHRTALLLISGLLVLLAQGGMFSVASAHTSASLAGGVQQAATAACLQPPQNVDLMTLSDAQLDSYGLPPRHLLNQNPKKWASVLAHAKHRVCGSSPLPENTTVKPNIQQGTSVNWSGYVAPSVRGAARSASTDFTIPTINLFYSSPGDAAAEWAGVGGYAITNPVLVQAGITTSVDTLGLTTTIYAWWEVYPNNHPQDLHLSLSPGDLVYAYASSNVNNDGYDYLYVADETNGSYNSFKDTNSSDLSDGGSGECIEERPGNPPVKLADFGTVQFSQCDLAFGNPPIIDGIGNWSGVTALTMTNNGHTLAYPGPLTNNGYNFTVTWQAQS